MTSPLCIQSCRTGFQPLWSFGSAHGATRIFPSVILKLTSQEVPGTFFPTFLKVHRSYFVQFIDSGKCWSDHSDTKRCSPMTSCEALCDQVVHPTMCSNHTGEWTSICHCSHIPFAFVHVVSWAGYCLMPWTGKQAHLGSGGVSEGFLAFHSIGAHSGRCTEELEIWTCSRQSVNGEKEEVF